MVALRDRYRDGIPTRSSAAERQDAETLYKLLEAIGGEKLVGPSKTLVVGTYWMGTSGGKDAKIGNAADKGTGRGENRNDADDAPDRGRDDGITPASDR